MKAYSLDLRERVLAACDKGGATQAEVAGRFSVSVRWIRDLLKRRRDSGSIAPKPHGGGRSPAFDESAAARLREAVRADAGATLVELAEAVGVACSPAATFRALRRMDITRKKSRGGRPSRTAPN